MQFFRELRGGVQEEGSVAGGGTEPATSQKTQKAQQQKTKDMEKIVMIVEKK